MRRVGHEIRHGHHAREDKSGDAGEQPDDYENAADKFQRAGEAHEREELNAILEIFRSREFEKFGCAMLKKEQAGHDAKGGSRWPDQEAGIIPYNIAGLSPI